MSKTSPEQLVEDIAGNFHTYLRRGVRVDSVIGDAHPDLDIDGIETLLRIHFVLTSEEHPSATVGVIDFIGRLEDEIRHLKTTTTREVDEFHGEVHGHIDWQQTVKTRARTGQPREPRFVCRRPEEHYDLPENLVLKRLLGIIIAILRDDLADAIESAEGFSWVGDWVETSGGHLSPMETLERVYEENVYLQRIEVDKRSITDRMLQAVKRSRHRLYREAALLLERYRSLMRYELDDAEARELLNHTIIRPEETEILFELYWIFRLLETFEDVTYKLVQDSQSAVIARWESGTERFVMYHNSTGEGLSFREELPEEIPEEDGYLKRMDVVLSRWKELTSSQLGTAQEGTLWGGRPDIVIERYSETDEGDELEQVFLGEVKYTQNPGYVAVGLKELLEYMAFAKERSTLEYVEDEDAILASTDVFGMLFVDRLDQVQETDDPIRICQYGTAEFMGIFQAD